MDPVRLELGYGLLSLIGDTAGRGCTPDQGPPPPARHRAGLRHAVGAHPGQHSAARQHLFVRLKEIEAGRGEIRAGMLLVMDPHGRPIALPGEATTEPTFGLPAIWVDPACAKRPMSSGYTVSIPPRCHHASDRDRQDNMADLLSYAETQKLLGELPAEYRS